MSWSWVLTCRKTDRLVKRVGASRLDRSDYIRTDRSPRGRETATQRHIGSSPCRHSQLIQESRHHRRHGMLLPAIFSTKHGARYLQDAPRANSRSGRGVRVAVSDYLSMQPKVRSGGRAHQPRSPGAVTRTFGSPRAVVRSSPRTGRCQEYVEEAVMTPVMDR